MLAHSYSEELRHGPGRIDFSPCGVSQDKPGTTV